MTAGVTHELSDNDPPGGDFGLLSGTWLGATARAADDDFRASVTANNKQFIDAVTKGDAASMADCYVSDGALLPPNHEMVKGKEAIEKFWAAALQSGVKSAALETVETGSAGDVGYEVGAYSLQGEGGKILDQGKYIVLIKRDVSRWKYYRDCWNSNLPPVK
jgi:ketosteroid isomerase-like protein